MAGRGAAAAAAARAYAVEMRPGGAAHVGEPAPLHFGERMVLDPSAIATLEIFESSDGSSAGSLCALIDRTRTPLGARALKDALARPSTDPMELEARWDAVEELSRRAIERQELQRALDDVGDLERRFARIATATAGPREVASWAEGLRAVPRVCSAGASLESPRLRASTAATPGGTPAGHARAGAAGPRVGRRRHPGRSGRRARFPARSSPRRAGGAPRDRG
jgi:DNA mismatch repair protein MutS